MIYYEVKFVFPDGNSETDDYDTLIEAIRVIDDGLRQGRIKSATITEKVDD